MKPILGFPAFFLASSLFFTGCYTHLATSNNYYAYHPRPIYSDTVRGNQPKDIVTYDTTMHGDTMFIDEHHAQATQQGNGLAQSLTPDENATTIVNNYYGSASYWDSYWGPSWGFSVGYVWPYYNSWYSPWWPYYYTPNYYSDWWSPYGYFGYYPPVYNCYAGFYGFGYPYYPYYPYYGGYGYHHHHFFADDDAHGYGFYDNVRPGRFGGEHRVGEAPAARSVPGVMAARPATPSLMGTRSGLAEANSSELAQSRATEVLETSANRNAPVHVLSPDAEGARSAAPAAAAPAIAATSAATSAATTPAVTAPSENVGARAVATSAPAAVRPIVVRRMDNGQTITTTNRAGRETVVVRRTSGYNAAAGYRYGNRTDGYSSRSYAPSSRSYSPSGRSGNSRASSGNYSAPARSYSPPERSYSPPERSYSPPERSYSPPERSYSPPERSYSPPERSAPAEGGGARSSGGSEGRAGGGGEGRAR